MPYNELIVTTDDREHALNRAAAELSPNGAAAIASQLHRLDGAASLGEVLQWLVESARRVSGEPQLFIVRGSALRPWRGTARAQPLAGRRFPLNVGGRAVAVLMATPDDAVAAATLDILTSYASRSLESMTLHKALGLRPPRIPKMSSELI